MTKTFPFRLLCAFAVLNLLASFILVPKLFAKDVPSDGLVIEQPWARATSKNATVGAGYLRITNASTESDVLLGVSSDAAEEVQIHEMSMEGNVMKMRDLPPSGLEIKPGGKVELKPGGMHIMFMGLKAPFEIRHKIEVTLKFAKAGDKPVTLDVLAGTAAPSNR